MVLFAGLSSRADRRLLEGGVGGGLGIMAVPMMSLVVPPVQAAGVLMPLLRFMHLFTLRAYRGVFDRRNLALIAPLGVWLGVTFQKRLPAVLFYQICHILIFLTGCRLAWLGTQGLLAR